MHYNIMDTIAVSMDFTFIPSMHTVTKMQQKLKRNQISQISC